MATSWDKLNHQPVNLADWRIQRCKDDAKKLPGDPIVRSSMVGDAAPPPRHPSPPQTTAAAISGRAQQTESGRSHKPVQRGSIPRPATIIDEPWQDNLRAARGIGLACLLGALMWAIGIAFVMAAWPQ